MNDIGWVMDLKLNGVQATLSRAGTSLLLLIVMCTVLVASDSIIVASVPPPQAPAVPEASPGLPDSSDSTPREGSHTVIPLGRVRISVPILMYHYIQTLPPTVDRLTYNLSVTPAAFTAQMDWLAAHGYHPVTFDDLRAYFSGQTPLPSKPVIITLDDGYRDLYTTAYPILKAHRFKAVAYIVTGFVGRLRYVTTDMILTMSRDGIEIASHTVDHPNLSRMALGSITYEVVASKQWLEKLIGLPVVDFAYPSGRFNALDQTELKAAGYSTAVTEQDSTYHTWATRFAWPRTRVGGGEVLSDFIKNLGPVEPYVTVAPTTS
jgi:peptidoglycan/xylan/chitin deacetylase (PgdA/CDA1 family)